VLDLAEGRIENNQENQGIFDSPPLTENISLVAAVILIGLHWPGMESIQEE
jgi:hypothetical protein